MTFSVEARCSDGKVLCKSDLKKLKFTVSEIRRLESDGLISFMNRTRQSKRKEIMLGKVFFLAKHENDVYDQRFAELKASGFFEKLGEELIDEVYGKKEQCGVPKHYDKKKFIDAIYSCCYPKIVDKVMVSGARKIKS